MNMQVRSVEVGAPPKRGNRIDNCEIMTLVLGHQPVITHLCLSNPTTDTNAIVF